MFAFPSLRSLHFSLCALMNLYHYSVSHSIGPEEHSMEEITLK